MISQAVKLGSDGLLIRLSLRLHVHFLLYLVEGRSPDARNILNENILIKS